MEFCPLSCQQNKFYRKTLFWYILKVLYDYCGLNLFHSLFGDYSQLVLCDKYKLKIKWNNVNSHLITFIYSVWKLGNENR